MIEAVKTSRGLLVVGWVGRGWGDWYEVALLDDDLETIEAYEVSELLYEKDLPTAFAALGFSAEEVETLAARFKPSTADSERERRGWFRRRSSNS